MTITPPSATVYEADATVFTAVYRDRNGNVVPNAPVTWSVQDTVRAQLGGNGYVLALKSGVVRVTATSGGLSASYDLMIVRPPVLAVSVLLPITTLSRGDVTAIGVRSDGPGGRVVLGRTATLSSDQPSIAMVDASGRVRAVAPGIATIRAVVDGVSGAAQVTVTASDTQLILSQYNGRQLPFLIAADTVSVFGVREYHEVYAESGSLQLSGSPLRYSVRINYYEYNVVTVNGQRRLEPRIPQHVSDFGLVEYDARGDLRMTSEWVSPLSHAAFPQSTGMQMNFRIPGDDEVLQLLFRREPA